MNNAGEGQRAVAAVLIAGLGLVPATAHAQDPMLLIDEPGFELRLHFQAGVNAVAEQNLFWNFADTFAPKAGFDSDTRWLEGYLMPGIGFTADAGDLLQVYGKISAVASGTLGTDAFDAGGTGAITLEDGYLGLRSKAKTGPFFDISLGPRPFQTGTGMLIANGGSSGFERGALKLGPRKAWEQAAILRFGVDDLTATAFSSTPTNYPTRTAARRSSARICVMKWTRGDMPASLSAMSRNPVHPTPELRLAASARR